MTLMRGDSELGIVLDRAAIRPVIHLTNHLADAFTVPGKTSAILSQARRSG